MEILINLSIEKKFFTAILIFSIFALMTSCSSSSKKEVGTQKNLKPEPEYTSPGARELPYQIGKTYEYQIISPQEKMGTASFTFERTENGYKLTSTLDLDDVEFGIKSKGESVLILDSNLKPMSYERTMDGVFRDMSEYNGVEMMKVNILHNTAIFEIRGPGDGKDEKLTRDIPERTFLADHNFIGQMALICSQPYLKSGRMENLDVLELTLRQQILLNMIPKIKTVLKFGDSSLIVYEVDMKVDGGSFGRYFITPDGVLLKAEEMGGHMIFELLNPDTESLKNE